MTGPEVIKNHFSSLNKRLDESPRNEILERLNERKIDMTIDLSPPKICLSLTSGKDDAIIGTLGDFIVVTGKAKARKSFLLLTFVASLLRYKQDGIIGGSLPENKRKVLIFDTEMAEFSVQLAAKRISKMSGDFNHPDLEVYTLRTESHTDIFNMIEAKLYSTPNVGFVVIDGIRDLASSINDEAEATRLSRALLRWTQELNICIAVVLHQNKNDTSVRGHLGTEMVNKAMTVLSVAKDVLNPDVSIVTPEYCRYKEPDPFAFAINEDGLPVFIDLPEKQSGKAAVKVSSFSDDEHFERLKGIFSEYPKPNGTIIRMRLKEMFGIGESKAREFVTAYEAKGLILFQGKKGSKDGYYNVKE